MVSKKEMAIITNGEKQSAIITEKEINRFTLHNYFRAILPQKGTALTLGITFSLTAICFGAILPSLLAHAIDLVSQHRSLKWGDGLLPTLSYALMIVILATMSNAIGLHFFARLDSPTQNRLRSQVLDRLLHESASFYADAMTGSLTGNVIAYTNSYATVQDTIFMRGINLILPLIVGLGIIAWQSLLLALMFVAIAIIIGVKTMIDSKARAPFRQARKRSGTQLNGFVGDVISNNATVRTFAGEDIEMEGLHKQQLLWRQAAQANMRVFSKHYISLVGGINILQVAGIGMAAWLALSGKISLGLIIFAISYSQKLSNGLLELGPLVQTYQGALMDASPISEILMSSIEVVDHSKAKKLKDVKGAISINSISYSYDDTEDPVLANVTLSIPEGQSLGLVGRSGGGKTTLTNLLLRLAELREGTITIDGKDISKVSQRSLRQAISYIPQDSHLFHRTIRENIAYGKPKATDRQIIAAAKKAHIWEFIKQLPDGLDTKVGERGVKLSGGQRQRIAIARAILKDAPILIFDEATSALDSESEQHIQASLDSLMRHRTAIVIAHRLSTIQKMDRVVVLDQGKIIEDGTHTKLLKQKGLYSQLWSHQTGGFIERSIS